MVRPKDAKIWNEDLVKALEAREQKAMREGKRDAHTWRVGKDKILAVRKDIYQFRTGTIANMPTNLTKKVDRLCEDIIRGVKSIYPDGHVPTNGSNGNANMAAAAAAYSSPPISTSAYASGSSFPTSNSRNNNSNNNNPFNNDHYMKTLKIRGGAFAILMAFHHSQSDVLRKAQICREAQRFCDDEMESNFHAGRMYGSWAAISTLQRHHLVTGGSTNPTYVAGRGFRSQPAQYTLTRNGRLFIEALLSQRPEAAAVAGQAIGLQHARFDGSPSSLSSMRREANDFNFYASPPPTPRLNSNGSGRKNIYTDKVELEEWIETAGVGDQKEFKVGKDRRKKLHDLCDKLQRQNPGLILTHDSRGIGRQRVLTIQIHSMPSSSSSSSHVSTIRRKRPLSCGSGLSGSDCEYDHQSIERSIATSTVTPIKKTKTRALSARENAARAAIKRQEEAKEEYELQNAISESKKLAAAAVERLPRPPSDKLIRKKNLSNDKETIDIEDSDEGEDENENDQIQKAIILSLKESQTNQTIEEENYDDENHEDDILLQSTIAAETKKISKRTHGNDDSNIQKTIIDIDDDNDNIRNKKSPASMNNDIINIDSSSDDDESTTPNALFSSSSRRRRMNKRTEDDNDTCAEKKNGKKEWFESNHDEDDVIEIMESQESTIDLDQSQNEENITNSLDDEEDSHEEDVIILDDDDDDDDDDSPSSNERLTIMIDNRERNRNATPRTLRMELTRHLASGPLRAVWPGTVPLAQVEEVRLQWGDIQYSVSDGHESRRRLGVSIERKRVNDLVQRSYDGDHLTQLFRMRQQCSLSVLLIENDTRRASDITPYNTQNREGFDPFDSTITCEEDVFRMIGRVIFSCDNNVKFLQTKDEQSSLRAIGALGLMCISAPTKYTTEVDHLSQQHGSNNNVRVSKSKPDDDFQVLCDYLKRSGISWRLAKRVANATGGLRQLEKLYKSCFDEYAKCNLLSHVIESNGIRRNQDDFNGSASGMSEAIYRIVSCSSNKINGGALLLLHKNEVNNIDQGLYLSSLYQGYSHDEALSRLLVKRTTTSLDATVTMTTRHVSIILTNDQAEMYFPEKADESSFYKLLIAASDNKSQWGSPPITMRTVRGSLSSKPLSVFELDGSKIVELIRTSKSKNDRNDYVALAKDLACRVATKCSSEQGDQSSVVEVQIILLVCGLQPALDADAKKPGYVAETKTIVDLLFSELLLCYNITVIQALRKKIENRVNVVRQLALACFHYGFLVQKAEKRNSKKPMLNDFC